MTLPTFLVIGAMKSGTTSLYRDLRSHPMIHLPDKELSGLTVPGVTQGAGLRAYEHAFRTAPDGAQVGDVSTTYSMLPDFTGVVDRARTLLSPDTKIIYLVREPVARIVSHHHHDIANGRLSVDIDTAVRSDPRLLNYTRYGLQLRPWIDAFGRQAVKVVTFESYVRHRSFTVSDICRFLEVPPSELEGVDQVHNASRGKPVAFGWRKRLLSSRLYRHHIRPHFPDAVRQKAARITLPKAPPRPAAPSDDTVKFILSSLAPDIADLCAMAGQQPWSDYALRRPSCADRRQGI